MRKFYLFVLTISLLISFSLTSTENQWNVYELQKKFQLKVTNKWTRQIGWEANDKGGQIILLEDGSLWDIGWWWQNKVKLWEKGDKIALFYHPLSLNPIYFKNLDKNQDAWGGPKQLSNGNLRLIQSIEELTGQCEIYWPEQKGEGQINFLSSRFEVASKELFQETGWKEGDIVIILGNENPDYPYWIYNVNSSYSVQHMLVRPIETEGQ